MPATTAPDPGRTVRPLEQRNALAVQYVPMVEWVLRRLRHLPRVRVYPDECRGAAYCALLRVATTWREGSGPFAPLAAHAIRMAILYELRTLKQRWRERLLPGNALDRPVPVPDLRDTEAVAQAVAQLRPDVREVVELRYGLAGQEAMSCARAAARVGMSPEQARRLHRRGLQRLRRVVPDLRAGAGMPIPVH